VEALSQTQYHVRPNVDNRFSSDGYDVNCLFGYDVVYRDTNLESGGDSFLQNFGEFLPDYTA
jgi:hypothetical protein